MSLVRNEQTKLTSALLNGIAIAAVAVGAIAPVAAAMLGTATLTIALLSAVVWLSVALILHLVARSPLRRLVE